MFCTSFFFCQPLETPCWRHQGKHTSEQIREGQTNEGSDPFAVLLLQVQVVSWVNALLHPSPVPRHPTLDGHISGSRTQSKLPEIFNRHGRGGLERQPENNPIIILNNRGCPLFGDVSLFHVSRCWMMNFPCSWSSVRPDLVSISLLCLTF